MAAVRRMNRQVAPGASRIRFVLRYVVAFYLIPVGLLVGLCGLMASGLRSFRSTEASRGRS